MQIIFEDNGIACICSPAVDLDYVVADLQAQGITTHVIDDVLLPSSKEFRQAWKVVEGQVSIHMPTARLIHMDRIRAQRNKQLSTLDSEYLIADEQSDLPRKAEVAAQKQYLRDLPQTYDLESCLTPAELSAAWPPGLEK